MEPRMFNVNDAHRNLSNLTPELALKWVRIANSSLRSKLNAKGGSLAQAKSYAQREANAKLMERRPYEHS